jgi:hypothetical protein
VETRQRHTRGTKVRAYATACRELNLFYWQIGRDIVERQKDEKWGKSVVERLAADIQKSFPGIERFSGLNVWRMRAFYLAWQPPGLILSQPVKELNPLPIGVSKAQILSQPATEIQPTSPDPILAQPVQELPPPEILALPWFHNVVLIHKLKDPSTGLWYAARALENGWSRSILTAQIESAAHKRQGKAITSFKHTLSDPQSDPPKERGLLPTPGPFRIEFRAGVIAHPAIGQIGHLARIPRAGEILAGHLAGLEKLAAAAHFPGKTTKRGLAVRIDQPAFVIVFLRNGTFPTIIFIEAPAMQDPSFRRRAQARDVLWIRHNGRSGSRECDVGLQPPWFSFPRHSGPRLAQQSSHLRPRHRHPGLGPQDPQAATGTGGGVIGGGGLQPPSPVNQSMAWRLQSAATKIASAFHSQGRHVCRTSLTFPACNYEVAAWSTLTRAMSATEIAELRDALPPDKREEVADFARFLLSRHDDARWEAILAESNPRPRLDAFLRESAAVADEAVTCNRQDWLQCMTGSQNGSTGRVGRS